MAKKINRKLLFITVILIILLFSSVYAVLIPKVHAADETAQEKGLSILSNVVGLDLAKYTVTTEDQQDDEASYLDVIPQTNVGYDLKSDESKLEVLYTFANGNLQMIHVLENEGLPHTTSTVTNARELAQDFLSNYQLYTQDPVYGELRDVLDDVDDSKNSTKTSGNTQLEVSAIDGYIKFKWTYTFNGILAPSKFVSMGFNNSFLTAFVDNWQLYEIGSTSLTLTEDEAVAIALETGKAHFGDVELIADTLEANFNESNVRWTSLIFDSSLGADNTRNEDQLMLYPVWRVGIALDDWVGQLYGIQVDVWADTKEVRYVQEAWSTLSPSEDISTVDVNADTVAEIESNSFMWIAVPTLATVVIGTAIVWVSRKKKVRYHNLLKPRSLKTGIILLCVLILMVTILLAASIATVSAVTQEGGAIVWGSKSTGAYDPDFDPPNYNWRKSQNERILQAQVTGNISDDFDYNGYNGYNFYGYYSTKSYVLNFLSQFNSTYARLAVVDFDHGVGRSDYSEASGEFHFLFEDNVGLAIGTYGEGNYYWEPDNGVYDMDVYPLVGDGQVIFAFINTCLSANLTNPITGESWQGDGTYGALGMPYAWTHRIVKPTYGGDFNVEDDISSNGYLYPDSGHQVYIGFYYGSASLEQFIPYDTGTKQYYRWVNDTFYYALYYDMSVNDALDHASWLMWGDYFGDSPIRTGFTAYWYNNPTQKNCRMAIYGNGEVHLTLRSLTVNSPVATADVYIDGEYRGTTGNSFVVDSGSHTVQVVSSTHTFHNFTGYSEFENPITVSVTEDTTVTANYYSNPPPQYTLSISAGDGGTTQSPYTPGDHQCTPGYIEVTAVPNSGYVFDHWLLDDEEYSENPISVPMGSDHELQANFVIATYVSSIHDSGGPVYSPQYIAGSQIDGCFAQLQGWGPYQYYAWIEGTMNEQATGHIYIYGHCYPNYHGHLYVYVSSDGNNWNYVSSAYVTSTSPYWIDCGTYQGTFNYIKVTVENPSEFVKIGIDAVRVEE